MITDSKTKAIKRKMIMYGLTVTKMAKDLKRPRSIVSGVLNGRLVRAEVESEILEYMSKLGGKNVSRV